MTRKFLESPLGGATCASDDVVVLEPAARGRALRVEVREIAARWRSPRSGVVLWPWRPASFLKAFFSARTKWRELRNGANNWAADPRGLCTVSLRR